MTDQNSRYRIIEQNRTGRRRQIVPAFLLLLILPFILLIPAAGQEHAKVIKVDPLWGAPYNLNGDGMTIGVYEQDYLPIKTHPEFDPSFITYVSPTSGKVRWHPTQVVGLIIAKGINAEARGIAANAKAEMFVSNGSIAQYITTLIGPSRPWKISNHSYGINRGWRYNDSAKIWEWVGAIENTTMNDSAEDFYFGYYDFWAHTLDSMLHKQPDQIAVIAAGNQRYVAPIGTVNYRVVRPNGVFYIASTSTKPHPRNGDDGYDVLAAQGLAKNAIIVGAVDRNGNLWGNSNTGPTDDGRIKPDVVGLGTGLTLCAKQSSLNGYETGAAGTSFATPAVAGTLLLLQQYWKTLFPGKPFNSATARGLLIHTADDLGTPGPDYRTGWGRVNGKGAADLMKGSKSDGGFSLREKTMNQGETYEFYIRGTANFYLKLTLAWNDVEGTPRSFVSNRAPHNDRTSMLVNDLDMRIYPVFNGVENPEFAAHPYILDPEKPSEGYDLGDNRVDNVEQIRFRSTNPYLPVDNFQHIYKVVIRHKGTLRGGKQDFSLFVSGCSEYLLPPRNVTASGTGSTEEKSGPIIFGSAPANSATVSWKASPGATQYDLIYKSIGSNSWKSKYYINGTEWTLTNLDPSFYQVRVRSRHGSKYSSWSDVVEFYGSNPKPPASVWKYSTTTTSAVIKWSSVTGVSTYLVKYAQMTSDNKVIGSWKSKEVSGTSTTLSLLSPGSHYIVYVRSKYSASLSSDWSSPALFDTRLDCSSYSNDDSYAGARTLRANDYLTGLLCQGEKEDWFGVANPGSYYKHLKVTLYQHPKPYRLSLYRRAKSGGTVSLVDGGVTGIGTKTIVLNNADFTNYTYYAQVWTQNPNSDYSNSQTYTVVAYVSSTPYPATEGDESDGIAKSGTGGTNTTVGTMKLWPNPVRNVVSITMEGGTIAGGSGRLTVIDAAGRIVLVRDDISVGHHRADVDLSAVPAGIYYLILESDGMVYRGEVVRMK